MRHMKLGWLVVMALGLAACDRLQAPVSPLPADSPYILVELDVAADHENLLEGLSQRMAAALREASPSIRYNARGADAEAARIRLADVADLPRARQALAEITVGFDVSEKADGLIEVRPTPASDQALAEGHRTQIIEILRRRLDPTGASRVSLEPHGDRRILVRVADAEALDAARAVITPMAQITFHMVHDVAAEAAAAGDLPRGTVFAQPYLSDGQSEIVLERPEFTGEHIANASPSTDSYTGQFVLAFQFDSEGARRFCRITTDHTGSRFAILLDGRVLTAPTINEPICGGSGQISGNFTAQSANELALLMRSGALPAPVRIVEEGVGAPRT
jgi:protein-export membrane protein SecD